MRCYKGVVESSEVKIHSLLEQTYMTFVVQPLHCHREIYLPIKFREQGKIWRYIYVGALRATN
jgi:hypothetical protein